MRRAVFIGIDLQRDFTDPEAAVLVPGADAAVAAARRLVAHAQQREIPLILTQDTHGDDDPVFEAFPPHAVQGTPGHDLLPDLGVSSYQQVPDQPLASFELRPGEPVVLQTSDHRRGLFQNLNADKVLAAIDAEEHVIFGLPVEIGVRAAGLGLCTRGKTTILVSDALASLDPKRSAFHLAALAGSGCRFLTVEGILQRYA
jgi:nicotinamidase-related amidase